MYIIYIYSVINVDWKDTLDVLCKLYMEMVFAAIRCLLASPYEPQTIEASQPSQLTIQISQQSTQQSIYPPPKLLQTLPPQTRTPPPPTLPNRNKSGTLKATPMRSKPKRKAYSAPKTPKMRKDVKATWRNRPAETPLGWQFGKCHEATAATNLGIQNFSKGINQPHPLLGQDPPKFSVGNIFFSTSLKKFKGRPLDKGDICTMYSPPKWERKMADPDIFCISNYQFKSVFWGKLHCIMSAEVMRFLRMPKSSQAQRPLHWNDKKNGYKMSGWKKP